MRFRSLPSLFALASSVLLVVSPGLADVVRPPPDDCAPGSSGRSSRRGPFCDPTTCSTDADCEGRPRGDRNKQRKGVCRGRIALCIEQKDFTSWRRRAAEAGISRATGIALDASGQEVDPEELLADEVAARDAW